MRISILFVLALAISTILQACKNPSESKSGLPIYEDELIELKRKGLASKIVTDTILLGFRFGMTADEQSLHLKKLVQEEKIKIDYSDNYYFEIALDFGTAYKGYLYDKFLDNRMISLGLVFKDESEPILVYSRLRTLYEQKCGASDVMAKPLKELDVFESYWIINNLKVKITSGVTNATVEYIDMRFEDAKVAADEREEATKTRKLTDQL